jgi:hypothetical protein
MSTTWCEEVVEHFTSNNPTIQVGYVRYGVVHQGPEQPSCHNLLRYGELRQIGAIDVFSMHQIHSRSSILQFYIGSHSKKVQECRYIKTCCLVIIDTLTQTCIVLESMYSNLVNRFVRLMYDSLKCVVLQRLYEYYSMSDIDFNIDIWCARINIQNCKTHVWSTKMCRLQRLCSIIACLTLSSILISSVLESMYI